MQDENTPKKRTRLQTLQELLRAHYKKLIIVACVLVVALLALPGGVVEKYVADVVFRSQYDGVVLSSLENTLKSEQLKFHVKLDKHAKDDKSFKQTLVIDGAYKKGAGLSASTDSQSIGAGTKMTQKSRWVIDSTGATHVNLQSFATEMIADGPVKYNQAMKDMVKRIVDNNNKRNKDAWTKYGDDKDLLNTFNTTGLNGCSLKAYYTVQSDPGKFLGMVKQLAEGVELKKTGGAGATDTFTITPKPSRAAEAHRTYVGSDLYRRLIACHATDYATTAKATAEALKNLTITVKVDTAKKLVSSLTFASKGAFDLETTFTPASDVSITVPKESAPVMTLSNTSMQQILEEYPHDFEHMQEAADVLKYGACANLDKYRSLAPQEAIDICEKMKNYKPPTQ